MAVNPEMSSQDHAARARSLLAGATEVFDAAAVQTAMDRVAAQINARFDTDGAPAFPLVLGVMGGAVVFAGQILTRFTFPWSLITSTSPAMAPRTRAVGSSGKWSRVPRCADGP